MACRSHMNKLALVNLAGLSVSGQVRVVAITGGVGARCVRLAADACRCKRRRPSLCRLWRRLHHGVPRLAVDHRRDAARSLEPDRGGDLPCRRSRDRLGPAAIAGITCLVPHARRGSQSLRKPTPRTLCGPPNDLAAENDDDREQEPPVKADRNDPRPGG